jgi:26S proteasome regulatory subunit N9
LLGWKQIATLKLQGGEDKETKELLEEGKSTLESMADVDPSVHASVYWVSSQYYKSRQDFAEFYRSALQYLSYTSVDTLSDDFKLVSSPSQLFFL